MKKIAMLSAIVLVFVSCFSPWQGDKGTFTVGIGSPAGNGRTAVPWNKVYDIENDLTHYITLSGGHGPEQTKIVKDTQKVYFSVTPGSWNISVEAYAISKTDGNRVLIAVGSATVEIKPGPNKPVTITMGELATEIQPIEGMVWIEGGTFRMGSPENEPGRHYENETRHSVTLTKGFYMGKYPVTQKQYRDVMGNNPSYFGTNTDNRPVEMVSWYDALVFCNTLSINEGLSPAYSINGSTNPVNWGDVPTESNDTIWDAVYVVTGSNGYRLPTEAQWEYACRAGSTAAFYWGTNYGDDKKANYRANIIDENNTVEGTYLERTTGVGAYAPNAYGLYDMHGNVNEFCWDWYDNYADGEQTDPHGALPGNSRVYRGGSWDSVAGSMRSAYRGCVGPFGWNNQIGFRLVRPESSGEPGGPFSVTGVAIDGPPTVLRGGNATYTASISYSGDPSDLREGQLGVVWSIVETGISAGTTITYDSGNGLLTVAENESLTTLTIEAVSVYDVTKKASYTVTVSQEFVAVTNITGGPVEATAGTPLTLTGTVVPSNATNQTITWNIEYTGNTGATLTNGNILNTNATATGTVTVRATITDGLAVGESYIQDFTVTVNQPASYTVTFDSNGGSGTIPTTQTAAAGYEITLPDGSNLIKTGYTFGGWNTNESGTGTNYNVGALYTVPNNNITLYAKWTVTTGNIDVTGVTLSQSTLTLTEGETATLTATVTPADATYQNVTWSWSGDSIIVTYDGLTATVRAVAEGTATITATAGGIRSAECTVTVSVPGPETAVGLMENQWKDGNITDGSNVDWYRFSVTGGTTYRVWWNDKDQGDGTKTVDVKVSAQDSNENPIFSIIDAGYNAPQSFTASQNGTVYLIVSPNGTGTYAIVYSTSNTRPEF